MHRLRGFATQNRQQQPTEQGGPAPQERPTTPPIVMDGAGEHINSSDYANRCREIMDLYKDLRDLGVHTTFDLPRIVVIGGQSSGKSSLVEAVSGINVPRDSGTCTRCPMECTLRATDTQSWSCTVEIRREYGTSGKRLNTIEREPFGDIITNKSEVELWVRRAQAAVLNPQRPTSEFYNMSVEQLREVSNNRFSKNVVQINVEDPDATNLSFVDLPGLIQNADDNLIETVKDLVERYMAEKNTLIVIAMPMTDDYENMQAVRLARNVDADPEGNRTIGVLTKPDLLPPGSLNSRRVWKAALESTTYRTKHGYYCVRLPDDDQRNRGVTKPQIDQNAEDFFNGNAPWNEIEDRARFGVPNFVKYISSLLVEVIENYLPELARKVRKELLVCQREYAELPPAPSRGIPLTEIMLRVTAFCQDITDAVFGDKYENFVQSNRAIYSKFKTKIVATTPDFRPVNGSVSMQLGLFQSSSTPTRGHEYVREVIKNCVTWELPKHVPFEATKKLVREYTRMWKDPTLRCFEEVVRENTDLLEKLLLDRFGQYIYLKKYIKDLTFKDRQHRRDEAHSLLTKMLEMENSPLFTQNSDYLSEDKKWFTSYMAEWNQSPRPAVISVPNTWTIEDEIKVMASVQAYFQVSHKRFIDYIPLAIEHELNQNLSNNIRNTLIQAIFEDSQSGRIDLADLLNEDPVIASKRRDLEDKLSRLQEIMSKLEDFEHLESTQDQDRRSVSSPVSDGGALASFRGPPATQQADRGSGMQSLVSGDEDRASFQGSPSSAMASMAPMTHEGAQEVQEGRWGQFGWGTSNVQY